MSADVIPILSATEEDKLDALIDAADAYMHSVVAYKAAKKQCAEAHEKYAAEHLKFYGRPLK